MTSKRPSENYYLVGIILFSTLFCLLCAKFDLEFYRLAHFCDLGGHLYVFESTFLGELPYRDFWQNDSPGLFYLGALAFKIFGSSIFTAKLLLAICIVISTAVLFCISKELVSNALAAVIALVSLLWGNFTLSIPYTGWFATCCGLFALLAFYKYLGSSKRKSLWLVAAGACIGLAFSFKQHIGALNLAAVALATAACVHIKEGHEYPVGPGDSEVSAFSRGLIIILDIVLLLPGYVIFPLVLKRQLHIADLRIGFQYFIVFFLPVFVVNSLVFVWMLRSIVFRGRERSFVGLLSILVKRELALAVGFISTIAPWYTYFSAKLGWKDFFMIISLSHPEQQGFKQGYIRRMQLGPLAADHIGVFLLVCMMCAVAVGLFAFGKSRKRLSFGVVVVACIAIVVWTKIFPLSWASSLMPYFPLLLEVLFIAGLLAKAGWKFPPPIDSKEGLMLLTLFLFNIYNFLCLVIFPDVTHYQMSIFPWLVLFGYAFQYVHHKACSLLAKPEFASVFRKKGILVAVALPFFLIFVARPIATFHSQYAANVELCERHSRLSGTTYASTLTEMNDEKGGVYVNSAFLEEVEEVVRHIRENTDGKDYIYGGPLTLMFNFLTDRKPPSKHRYLYFNAISESQQIQLAEDLREKRPKYFIYDDFGNTILSVPKPERAVEFFSKYPPVGDYFSKNYRFERKIGRFYLFRRTRTVLDATAG